MLTQIVKTILKDGNIQFVRSEVRAARSFIKHKLYHAVPTGYTNIKSLCGYSPDYKNNYWTDYKDLNSVTCKSCLLVVELNRGKENGQS